MLAICGRDKFCSRVRKCKNPTEFTPFRESRVQKLPNYVTAWSQNNDSQTKNRNGLAYLRSVKGRSNKCTGQKLRSLDQKICQMKKQTFIPSECVGNLEDRSNLQCRHLLDSRHSLEIKVKMCGTKIQTYRELVVKSASHPSKTLC